jgi:hypothetical protein
MALRSFWTAAWLMAGVKTQTFGPNVATLASGQIEVAAAAAWEGTAAASPAPAIRAAAARTGRHRRRAVELLVIGLISITFAP